MNVLLVGSIMYVLGVCAVLALLEQLYDYARLPIWVGIAIVVLWPAYGLGAFIELLVHPFRKLFR